MAKTNANVRSNKTESAKWAVALMAGLLIASPALAQTTPQTPAPSQSTIQKQPTDGGDSPSNPRATDASAAEWRKQHIDGGDSPANPRATDSSAADWRKQHPLDQ